MMVPAKPRDVFDDEDLPLELPGGSSLDGEDPDRGEEVYTPDDDSDLGLSVPGDEAVGLDGGAGIDEPLEAELQLDEADEEQSFTDYADAADDLEDDDDDIADGEEDGWTRDNDDAEDDGFNDAIAELEELGTGDAGEEGFEDEAAAIELELPEPQVDGDDGSLDLPADDLEIGAVEEVVLPDDDADAPAPERAQDAG